MVSGILKNPEASILLIIIIFFIALPFSSQNNFPFPIAKQPKPYCVDRCGDIAIPFPFGTTPDCYLSYDFLVTCVDNDATVSVPPTLFAYKPTSNIKMTHISLDGQVKYLQNIAKDCYDSNGTSTASNNTPPWVRLGRYFTVNNTANKFTVVGCDSYAFIYGRRGSRNYTTGCTAMCSSESDVTQGACAGAGCCQTAIPEDVTRVTLQARSYSNYTKVWNFSRCGYAFVAEEAAFSFAKENLTNLSKVQSLPMLVDWAIGNHNTCEEATADATNYACASPDSECYVPTSGNGYRCRCRDGFEGNPYLSLGCVDIHECADEARNDCSKKEYCTDQRGNYTCSCPKGYDGDGRGKDKDGCILSPKKQSMKIAYVLIGVASGIIALLLAIILLYLELKRRSHKTTKQKFFLQNGGVLFQQRLSTREGSDMVMIFSSSELQKATDGFHNNMIIGQGGFGTVYKGVLADNRTVAIKKSKRIDPTQIEQFINEIFVLSKINHRNVVRLLGCCLETDAPLLVYEFIPNGTLASHIHNKANASSLDWNTRLKIAAETAGVLAYLHSSASNHIIHRDVKTDNILLDHSFTAKVADFGASKLVPIDLTQLSTMVQGTFGYLDPEYMQTNQLTEKSDVYSFGVVLLELITGRRALSFDRPVEEKSLANYFLSILKQDLLSEIVDGNIVGLGNMEQISEVSKLAKECLNVRGEDRPSMKEVEMELEGLLLGGKHSWERKDNVDYGEEMESLLPINGEGLVMSDLDNGDVNISVGYDSLIDHILLPINGGR